MPPNPKDPEQALTSGPNYVAALADELVKTHGVTRNEANEMASTAFTRLSHAEDGGLVVALPTGLRTRADASTLKVYAQHLAQVIRRRDSAEGHEARVAQKRRQGGYAF